MCETIKKAQTLFRRAGGRVNGAGFFPWFSGALGVTRAGVHKWKDDGAPLYVVAVVELLDALPVQRWPERWRVPDTYKERGAVHSDAPSIPSPK